MVLHLCSKNPICIDEVWLKHPHQHRKILIRYFADEAFQLHIRKNMDKGIIFENSFFQVVCVNQGAPLISSISWNYFLDIGKRRVMSSMRWNLQMCGVSFVPLMMMKRRRISFCFNTLKRNIIDESKIRWEETKKSTFK